MLSRFIKFISSEILVYFLAITLLILSPIFVLFFGFFFLYRKIVFYLVPLFYKKYGKMLSVQNTMLAVDELYSAPKNNIVLKIELEDCRDLSTSWGNIVDFGKKMLHFYEERNEEGELIYPELRQFPKKKFGYYFWRDCLEVDPLKQLEIVNEGGSVWNQEDLRDFVKTAVTSPFKKGSPLFQLYIIKNVGSQGGVVLMLKISHCLADGYSVFKFLLRLADKSSEEEVSKIAPKINFSRISIFKLLLMPIRFFFDFSRQFLIARFSDSFQPGGNSQEFLNISETNAISFDGVKRIARNNKVGVSDVFVLLYAGGIRRGILESGGNFQKPIYSYFILPMTGHPFDKLRNRWTMCLIQLPVEVHDPIERLLKTSKNLAQMRNSTIPISFFFFLQLLGSLPLQLVKLVQWIQISRIKYIFTGMPGPKQRITINEIQGTDFSFFLGKNSSLQFDYTIGSQTYGDSVEFSICDFAPNSRFDIARGIEDEFKELIKYSEV